MYVLGHVWVRGSRLAAAYFCRIGLAGIEIKSEVGDVEGRFEVVDIPTGN
jgi:hypothetical protein